MSYNLLHYPTGTGYSRKTHLKYVVNSYHPDLFMVCELESQSGSNEILNYVLATPDNRYAAATFHYNSSSTYQELQQMVYYNVQKLELVAETYLLAYVRDINHYTFKLRTQEASSTPVFIDVYVAHFKSSGGTNNENTRRDMAQVFTDDLYNIPSGHHVVFAGDFNLYRSTEPAYQELMNTANAIVMKDPVNRAGYWHNNSSFQDIHSQSTHVNGDNTFVGGGLDDRFDFILLSNQTFSAPELHYVSNSYAVYGNNGNCFNKAITNSSCSGNFDTVLRGHLYDTSDHLPVVLELQSNQTPLSINTYYANNTYRINEGNIIKNYISISPKNYEKLHLRILNILGQELLDVQEYTGEKIFVGQMKQGIYFLNVEYKNTYQIIRFIKEN